MRRGDRAPRARVHAGHSREPVPVRGRRRLSSGDAVPRRRAMLALGRRPARRGPLRRRCARRGGPRWRARPRRGDRCGGRRGRGDRRRGGRRRGDRRGVPGEMWVPVWMRRERGVRRERVPVQSRVRGLRCGSGMRSRPNDRRGALRGVRAWVRRRSHVQRWAMRVRRTCALPGRHAAVHRSDVLGGHVQILRDFRTVRRRDVLFERRLLRGSALHYR